MNQDEQNDLPPPPPSNDDKNNNGRGNRPQRPAGPGIFIWLIFAAIVIFTIHSLFSSDSSSSEIENEAVFKYLVDHNKIEKAEIVREPGGKTYVKAVRVGEDDVIAVQMPDGQETKVPKNFKINIIPETAPEIQKTFNGNGIPSKITYESELWSALIIQIIPIVLFVGLLYFVFYRNAGGGMGGAMNFGKSRARKLDEGKQKIMFKDVAGADEAKEEVQEIVDFLKAPQKFAKLGGRIPKGVLLMGPPGTGKTLLAKAIAGEAGVPFFSISGSDFVEMFVGVGASRVRDMFAQAKHNAPCIIFIDEIDAVGRSRFTGIGGGHDEREQTLNAMLVEMDGFEPSSGVIVMAATNRPDVLDKALLRPGRFDRQVVIDLPTMDGRLEILKIHAAKVKLADGVDLGRVARGTPGFSGADLANLVNEAALIAARGNKEAIEQTDFEEARDKVCWGRERRGQMKGDDEKRLTAFHEAGHAIVMSYVKNGEPIHKVTIIPRGMALGATMFLPKKDRIHYSKNQMLAQLSVSMGGRVAEELFLEDISAGASQDLRQATDLAHRMICDWGMSEKLGPRTFGAREEMMFLGREVGRTQDYSEATAKIIDSEVDTLVRNAYAEATAILKEHEDKVRILVDALLEYETVDGEDVEMIVKEGHIRERPVKTETETETETGSSSESSVQSSESSVQSSESSVQSSESSIQSSESSVQSSESEGEPGASTKSESEACPKNDEHSKE